VHNTRSSKSFIVKRDVQTDNSEIATGSSATVIKCVDKLAINCCTLNKDLTLLGVCNINGDIGIIDVATLSHLNKITMHELPVQGCAFASDEQLLFTGSVDYKVGYIKPGGMNLVNLLVSPYAVGAFLILAFLIAQIFKSK
jgi:hypothetical protein